MSVIDAFEKPLNEITVGELLNISAKMQSDVLGMGTGPEICPETGSSKYFVVFARDEGAIALQRWLERNNEIEASEASEE
jgi:hypothetical protein